MTLSGVTSAREWEFGANRERLQTQEGNSQAPPGNPPIASQHLWQA